MGGGEIDGLWAPRRRALTIGLVLGITVVAVESLAVATVLPNVRDDLGGLALYGWVFSALFLGSIVGAVAAGQRADRVGPAPAFALGLAVYAAGLVAAGTAGSMPVLVAARFLQGLGGGAIPAVAYVAIGRTLPAALQPRMMAVLASAWVVPGLAGPALAGVVEHAVGWRWIFLGLLPLVGITAVIALPPLRRVAPAPPTGDIAPTRLPDAVRVAVGASMVLAGLGERRAVPAVALVVVGVAVGVRPLLRLLPPGTASAREGLPAAVLCRGLLTFTFFGVEAFVPLMLREVRGTGTGLAGLVLTSATVSWTSGSWVQDRLFPRLGAARLVGTGGSLVLVGAGVEGLVLYRGLPVVAAVVGWAVAGLGMGLAFSPLSVTTLTGAPVGREGEATSSLQLADMLGTAVGTGVSGALVALGAASDWPLRRGVLLGWIVAGGVGVVNVAASRRLPGPVLAAEPAGTRPVP